MLLFIHCLVQSPQIGGETLTDSENNLINIFENLNDQNQSLLLEIASNLLKNQESKEIRLDTGETLEEFLYS